MLEMDSDVSLKELEWRNAVETAMKSKDQKIEILNGQIDKLQKQLESTLQLLLKKERQIATLEDNLKDLQCKLEDEQTTNQITFKKFNETMTEKIYEKEKEVKELNEKFLTFETETRERHAKAILNLTKESRHQIDTMENEIEKMKNTEKELINNIEINNKIIQEKNEIIQLNNNKINECENEIKKIEEDNLKLKEQEEKSNKIKKENEMLIKNFSENLTKLRTKNKEIKDGMVIKIEEINNNLIKNNGNNTLLNEEILQLKCLLQDLNNKNLFMKNILVKLQNEGASPNVTDIAVQVNLNLTEINFEDTIILLKRKVSDLMENEINLTNDIKKITLNSNEILRQNLMLKEVIKSMRKDKEELLKEKQIDEDEQRVKRLEESVTLLKTQITHNHQSDKCTGDGLWVVLNEMKEDLKRLKGKSWHKVMKMIPQQDVKLPSNNCNSIENIGVRIREDNASDSFQIPVQPVILTTSSSSTEQNKNFPLQVPKKKRQYIL